MSSGGPFLQKLYEGVDRSNRCLGLREYKTGGEEGYAGRVDLRVFLFFSNPAFITNA